MSMLELEVKAALSDDALERLRHLDLSHIDRQIQVDTYYRHPCNDFVATDEALRIRRSEHKTTITYKGPRLSQVTKMREEHELMVNDFDEAHIIFRRLGFVEVASVEKTRERFERNGICIAIDDVRGLGRFIEVEMLLEDLTESAEEQVFSFLEEIGIDRKSTVRESYLELLSKTTRNSS
ncbi:MAG: class IV adenylate cyclase [Euryarchaeota archaeon]|nr:class IV adenylate cyclase [Euryarchaeota archaeon]